MDEETRNEIETIKNRIAEVAGTVRTLQMLAEQHHAAIKSTVTFLEEIRGVHPSP